MNTLEISPQQRIRKLKKKALNGNSQQKPISEIKNSQVGLNSRMEVTEKSVNLKITNQGTRTQAKGGRKGLRALGGNKKV